MGIPVVATDLPEIRRFNADARRHRRRSAATPRRLPAAIAPSLDAALRRRGRTRGSPSRTSNSWAEPDRRDDDADRRGARAPGRRRASGGTRRCAACTGRRGRASPQAVLALAAVYLLVFQTNLLWWAAAPLQAVGAAAARGRDRRVRRRRRRVGQGRRRRAGAGQAGGRSVQGGLRAATSCCRRATSTASAKPSDARARRSIRACRPAPSCSSSARPTPTRT